VLGARRTAEAVGAITIGRLDIYGVPTGYGLQERPINLYAPFGLSFDRGAALTAAGIGALVLADEPAFSPEQLKQRLIRTADEKYAAISLENGEWNWDAIKIDPQTGDCAPTQQAFRFRRVNAARALGLRLEERWPVNALNTPAAWKTATGRGVKVALIDQGFHVNNPAFKDRLVDKMAFPGQDFTSHQNPMALQCLRWCRGCSFRSCFFLMVTQIRRHSKTCPSHRLCH
jgi:hypothetical protein